MTDDMTGGPEEAAKLYRNRMRLSPQFARFGIEPVWKPMTRDIEGFCHDEVVRQYHDTRVTRDGGVRVELMVSAWEYAQAIANSPVYEPRAIDIRTLGQLIEPTTNLEGFRRYGVYIGNRAGAPWESVPEFVDALVGTLPVAPEQYRIGFDPNRSMPRTFLEDVKRVRTVDDWYLAFEWIHPFGDGNGRTGKILHNWLLGSLDDPVLVDDYFGGGNP